MGPVHHAVISISTGLYLGGSVTLPGLSVHQIVKMILKNITHAAVEDVIHLNRNLFCADQGYMHAVTNDILQYGGQLLGTQKRIPGNAMIDENAAKGYVRKPGPTVKIISNEGPKCDYWAVKEVKTGRPIKRISIFQMLYRDLKLKAVQMTTTVEKYGPGHWSFISKRKKDDVPDSPNSDENFRFFHENIVQLTSAQGRPDWFIMRLFRITGSVACRVLTYIICEKPSSIEFPNELDVDAVMKCSELLGIHIWHGKQILNLVELHLQLNNTQGQGTRFQQDVQFVE